MRDTAITALLMIVAAIHPIPLSASLGASVRKIVTGDTVAVPSLAAAVALHYSKH